jgi:hypothetical protein
MFLGSSRSLRLTTLPSSVSRLFRKCGILDISDTYRPLRTVIRIALLYSSNQLIPLLSLNRKFRYRVPYSFNIILILSSSIRRFIPKRLTPLHYPNKHLRNFWSSPSLILYCSILLHCIVQ